MSSQPSTPVQATTVASDHPGTPGSEHWNAFLAEQRPVMDDLLARQQDHLTGLEERLSHELALLSETIRGELLAELGDERAALLAEHAELKTQERELASAEAQTAAQLQEWSEELTRRQTELNVREQNLQAQADSFAPREAEQAQLAEQQQQAGKLLDLERSELLAESQDLAAREARLTEREQQYTTRQEHLNEAIEDTLAQRQRIAAAFVAQRKLQGAALREERQELEIFRETLEHEGQRTQASLQQQAALRQQQHEQQHHALQSSQAELSQGIRHWQELCGVQQSLVNELQATRQQLQQNLAQLQQDQLALDNERAALAAKETDLFTREAQLATSRGSLAADQLAVTQHDAEWATERQELLQRIARLETAGANQQSNDAANSGLLAELEQLRSERQNLLGKLRDAELNQAGSQTQAAQLRALAAERDGLAAKLTQAEQHAHLAEEKLTQQAAVEDDPQRIQELQKRFELAIEDVRALKRKNADLEANLGKARRSGVGDAALDAGGGWEAMKQKMIAQLESQDSGLEPNDRREIEATLRRTDELVAAKEREIADLRELLEQQSNQVGELAVGAAAIAQIMDHDELILQERERLQHAQEEWREKLKQAEIDISLERARLARERSELQEKQHTYDKQASQNAPTADGKPAEKPTSRGRWLTRLGLKDEK